MLDKPQIIEQSLRCFVFGLIGILPGIGVPFAVVALGYFLHVSQHKGTIANPAESYLYLGAIGATIGVALTLLLAGVIAIELWFKG